MKKSLTYKKSGVDIDKANDFIKKISPIAAETFNEGTIGSIGGFSGLFKADFRGMKEPVLVSSTDGVGTKLMVANRANKLDTIGIDLVAMCVNDIVTCAARPLFFLDYFATGKIAPKAAVEIIKGVVEGCKQAGCALIGGETAEMPGLYKKGDFDIAGFAVGVVDKKDIIDGSLVKPGDRIVGIGSSGIHSNGYSLVRKVFSAAEISGKLKKELLKPTAIYVKPLLDLMKNIKVKAVAHITGGGFYDNIPRVLPDGTAAMIDKGSWDLPSIFELIQKKGRVADEEMYRTFNMGVGMAIVIEEKDAIPATAKLKESGLASWNIGEIIKWAKKEVII